MSLRGRLLLAVAALVSTSLAAAAWVSTLVTSVELERLAEAEEDRRLETELASLGEVLETNHPARWPALIGAWQGFDALLFGPDERLLAASSDRYDAAGTRLIKDGFSGQARGVEGAVKTGGALHAWKLLIPERRIEQDGRVFRLFVLPTPLTERPAVAEPFRASAARWTLWLVLGLGVVALAVAASVARRLAGPIEELTAALADGDLSRRVTVRGDDEISRLAEAFNGLATRLERAERLRQDLVTDVAHELRTPLTHLRGEIESLEDGLLQPTPETLASLREEVGHLARLVEDLQQLALAEAGRLRLELARVDLRAEVTSVLRSFGNDAARPRLEARVPAATAVRADRRRLRQILVNLVDNACRHTPADGRVTVSAATDGDRVTVRVRDQGPGIAADRRDDVFERFVRLDGSRQRATGGAGLGLAIVKSLVAAHGGRVWIEDPPPDEGPGTIVAFTVPAASG